MAPPDRRGSKLTEKKKKRIAQRQRFKNMSKQMRSIRGGGDKLSVADQERIAAAQKFKAPSGMGSTPAGGFGEDIKAITNPQQILDKSKEIFETKKTKDIRKKADEMFALIKDNPTLTNFQKNNIRQQIQFV